MYPAQGMLLLRKGMIVLDKLEGSDVLLKKFRVENLGEETPIVTKFTRFDEQDLGNICFCYKHLKSNILDRRVIAFAREEINK